MNCRGVENYTYIMSATLRERYRENVDNIKTDLGYIVQCEDWLCITA
jgi:hypothetical protein